MKKAQKAQASKRNRHTGKVNTFKAFIMTGTRTERQGRVYYSNYVGMNAKGQTTGISIVRA